MGEIYAKMLADFKANGGTEFVAFNDASQPSDAGSYGTLSSIYDDSSQRFAALVAAGDGPGAASSGGETLSALKLGGALHAMGGNDFLLAGPGTDTLDGGDGNDRIVGSSGTQDQNGALIESDLYMGGAGADTIFGGVGNDHIYGNELTAVAGSVDGADSLFGGGGNDYVQGNAGADIIDGGDGNDRLYGGADADSILGGAGNDYLQGNKGNDTLSGGDGIDIVHGGADDDQLSGDAGNDQLSGDAGNDTLTGGDGNDDLTGGAGFDRLTGGTGSDRFLFAAHDAAFTQTGVTAWTTDEITDFTDGADMIGLGFHPALVVQSSAGSLVLAASVAEQLLQVHAGQADVAAVSVGSDTYLFYDASGVGGTIDSAIKVDGIHATAFTAADFV
jgi:serralysin